jgi:type II secretory pathway component PulC
VITAIGALLVFVAATVFVGREHDWKTIFGLGAPQTSTPTTTLPERPVVVPPPLPGGDASISPDALQLVLVRTEFGRDSHESLAFIGTSPRNPQTYQEGSLLANGARVKSIAADHVILERAGRTVRLNVAADLRLAEAQIKGKDGALDSVGGSQPAGPDLVVSTERVTDFIRPRPMYDSVGRFVAYELQPGADPATFQRLGLEPGDRMVSADGETLISSQQAASALQVVDAGGSIKASVQRGGEIRTLRIDGGMLPQAGSSGDEAGRSGAAH